MSDQIPSSNRFYLYIHVEADTGRVFYVGKGSGYRAWSSHSRNRHWRFRAKSHGFFAYLVKDNLTEDAALQQEIELIAWFPREQLATYTSGGGGVSGYRHTEKARAAMSVARRGRSHTEESKAKMSETIRSSEEHLSRRREAWIANNPSVSDHVRAASSERMRSYNENLDDDARLAQAASRKGASLTEEHRKKVGDGLRGKKRGPMPSVVAAAIKRANNVRKRPVKTDCGLWFESVLAASQATKARQGNISNNCAGRTKSAGGFVWSFADVQNDDRKDVGA